MTTLAAITPAVNPISRLDVVRARTWNLRLLAAPMAEEPATKVQAIVPGASPALEAAPCEDDGPAWTWDAWTDADTWELGPEEDFVAEPMPAGSNPVEFQDVADEAPRNLWGNPDVLLSSEQAAVLADVLEGLEDGPAPSWDAPRFEPEGIAAAYLLGFELGKAGEYPKAPARYSEREAYHFNCGRLAGFMKSEDGLAWQDDMRACRDRVLAETPREHDGYPAGYTS